MHERSTVLAVPHVASAASFRAESAKVFGIPPPLPYTMAGRITTLRIPCRAPFSTLFSTACLQATSAAGSGGGALVHDFAASISMRPDPARVDQWFVGPGEGVYDCLDGRAINGWVVCGRRTNDPIRFSCSRSYSRRI